MYEKYVSRQSILPENVVIDTAYSLVADVTLNPPLKTPHER